MQRQGFTSVNVKYFERSFLDNKVLIESSSLRIEPLDELSIYHVPSLSRFWETNKPALLYHANENMLAGLYEAKTTVVLNINGGTHGVEILYGSPKHSDKSSVLFSSLNNSFHGAEIIPRKETSLPIPYSYIGIVTGTPSKRTQGNKLPNLDFLTRGICNKKCGIIIIATPLNVDTINNLNNMTLNEMRLIQDSSRHVGQENPVAKQYTKLLEKYLDKLEKSKSQGLWNTTIFYYAETQSLYHQLSASIKSAFTVNNSSTDKIRTIQLSNPVPPGSITNSPPPSPGVFKWPYMYTSQISTEELALQMKPPSSEFPGFRIKPYVRFNVSPAPREGVNIGEILDQGKGTNHQYKISVEGLKKHGLIVGSTGSGKTNTVFYLLRELFNENIPFLVLEPAKTEYRKLLFDDLFKDRLQVFTLGDNTVSPFRINPFYVQPGIPVQTHLDFLKSVFNASFYMWGPLPHILEQCLVEVYADKGWDLTSNINNRGTSNSAYPTLTDLYNKVDDVVDKLGYSSESNMELKSSLKNRLNSLRIGGKGLMLDTTNMTDLGEILKKPTVLELESLGDDDEKGFLMGLIFTMLYEYYLSQGLKEEKPLKHITIIEEAHRLLGDTKNQAYTGDMKGKAVEIFTNILSEIRAYGEGLLIVEQIPSKLSSDVIKNTNLKIMHRTVSNEDRNTMAASMSLKETDASIVSTFKVGRAAVFSEGDDGPYHVKVPYAKLGENIGVDEDDEIKQAMKEYQEHPELLAPYVSCSRYCEHICHFKSVGQSINQINRYTSTIPPLLLSIISGKGYSEPFYQLFETGNDQARNSRNTFAAKTCATIQATEQYFKEIGALYQWSYTDQEQLLNLFQDTIIESLRNYHSTGNISLNMDRQEYFREKYHEKTKGIQPSKICTHICKDNTCQYRHLLLESLNDNDNTDSFISILNTGGPEMWPHLYDHCEMIAETLNQQLDEETHKKIVLCYGLQRATKIDEFTQEHISQIMNNLLEQSESREDER